MTGWLLNVAYAVGLVALGPVWIYRMVRHGRYREGWAERLGLSPVRYGRQPAIWIHGVSVGEVAAARELVAELHRQLPDHQVVITSTTDTGMDRARALFAPDHVVFRYPLDFTFAVRAALGRIRPELVVLMEGDVFPNFLDACRRRGAAAVLVNGRLGPRKGYPRYRRFRPLAARLFNRLTAIAVQHRTYAEMFRSLGVAGEKITVTGMMKFDTAEIADRVAGQDALAGALGLTDADRLIVAGGTGPGEEQVLLGACRKIRDAHDRARLAIVPRKPERFERVARLIAAAGFDVVRRSERPDGAAGQLPHGAVILGDTMGELRKFYALAECVFVGRSLVPMGGSDMIEPAALARPVAFGPHTFNFPQAESMVAAGCAVRVAGEQDIAELFSRWLCDRTGAAEIGRKARQFVRRQRGATRRNVELICGLLGRSPAPAPGAIATDLILENTGGAAAGTGGPGRA